MTIAEAENKLKEVADEFSMYDILTWLMRICKEKAKTDNNCHYEYMAKEIDSIRHS